MSISIHALTAEDFSAAAPTLVDLYITAMKYPPRIRSTRIEAWKKDSTLPGFRAFCALNRGALAGLAYGFHGCPHTWWHEQVQRGLRSRQNSQQGAQYNRQQALLPNEGSNPLTLLENYFEVAEVHVAPPHQGQGVGRRLLSHLLHGLHEPLALLSTPEVPGEANKAFRLYRSFGFQDLLRSFYFPGDSRPFAVLGAPLPLPAQNNPLH